MKLSGTRQTSKTASIPAPVGGWNVRDSLAEMPPTDAPILENWWPTTTDVMIRKGYSQWATGLPGTVDTLFDYNSQTGSKLFAVTSTGSIYEVTSTGAVGAPAVTGLSNGQWQYVSYTNSGGSFLLAVNGTDWMLRYNGTTWVSVTNGATNAVPTITGNGTIAAVNQVGHGLLTGNTITVTGSAPSGLNAVAVPITRIDADNYSYVNVTVGTSTTSSVTVQESITGISTKNIDNINAFKKRIWLNQVNGTSQWYLATDAIAGAATEFPFGPLLSLGGKLVSMGTWTMDAGGGIDDQAVFFSSEGEVLVYTGTDPASATTFSLIGVFKVGMPVGKRCQMKFLGDIYSINLSGVSALSQSLLTAAVTIKSTVSDKISPAIAQAIALNNVFGWQLAVYPSVNMLICNAPAPSGNNYAFAMNTITGAWTKFTFENASPRCWQDQGNSLYFGATGFVGRFWDSYSDNVTGAVTANALTAFQKFGIDTQQKHMTLVRPNLTTTGTPSILVGINYDYDQASLPTGVLQFGLNQVMVWGQPSMIWGAMFWGGSLQLNNKWQFAGGIGYSAAFRMSATSNGSETRWAATDFVFQYGGII
jgi:hypothetical protein